jgi:hypothetical protein
MSETIGIATTDPSSTLLEFGSALTHQNPPGQAKDYFAHTCRRLKERYDLEITKEQYAAMNHAIRDGKGHYCSAYKGTKRYEIWLLHFRKQDVIVGWDKVQKIITTVLPKKYVPHYKQKSKRIEALEVLLHAYPEPKKLEATTFHRDHGQHLEGICASCGLEGKMVPGAKEGWFSKTLICHDCKTLLGLIMKDMTRTSSVIAYIRRERGFESTP